MTLQQLLADVEAGLGAAVTPVFNGPGAVSDLYEVWTFCTVLRAGRDEGYAIEYRDASDQQVATAVFRIGPGWVYGGHPYTHAFLTHANTAPMELHQGVRVEGQSGTPHECDVVLLTDTVAAASRASLTNPSYTGVRFAFECKFYTAALPLRLLREFLGLASELGRRPTWLATSSTHAALHAILGRHSLRWEDELEPGNAAATRLRHELRTFFDHAKR